jgi:hypothetical protein
MTDEELAGEVLSLLDQTARRKKLEEAESGLLEVFLEDARDQLDGRQGAKPGVSAGIGSESPPAGGTKVLPPDGEAA